MSSLFAETYIGDQSGTRKPGDSSSSVAMTCNILSFLDASPSTLFDSGPEKPSDRDDFFADNFEAFISCMIAADESMRRLAGGVARRLFADESVMKSVAASKRLSSPQFLTKFWKLTYVSGGRGITRCR
jgi:neurofibromin 1